MWFINGDANLSANAIKAIENPVNINFINAASLWEIAIKVNIGKLTLTKPYRVIIREIEDNFFEILPITFNHTLKLIDLPLHHRDPFDRLIIAQALAENMAVITRDEKFKNYPINMIW